MGIKYIEVFVNTPKETCLARNLEKFNPTFRKKSNSILIEHLYEVPTNPEIIIESSHSVEEAIQIILDYLKDQRLLDL